MVVAPAVADVARTVVHMTQLTDADIEAEFARLTHEAEQTLPPAATQRVEYFADVRFRGQSYELKVAVDGMTMADISRRFYSDYRAAYGRPPGARAIEIVTLRVRRIGPAPRVELPTIEPQMPPQAVVRQTQVIDARGQTVRAAVLRRGELLWTGKTPGPVLLVDPEATTFIPAGWMAQADTNGIVQLTRMENA
jgi:N-methylhydantoinase A